jgi:hypothetical protein
VTHPGGTLLDHLNRVARRLQSWGHSPEIALAGLTHAAYGTAGFADHLITPGRRSELVHVIGGHAEELVYRYGACVRDLAYPQFARSEPFTLTDRFTGSAVRLDDADTRAFIALTFANEIDVMTHNAELADRHGTALHDLAIAVDHWLTDAARPDIPLLRGLP